MDTTPLPYTPDELTQIQKTLQGQVHLTNDEMELAKKTLNYTPPQQYLAPFILLAGKNPDLFHKLTADPKVAIYSSAGFFPETYPLVYEHQEVPKIGWSGGNRGAVALLIHPEKACVIKPLQSTREYDIAKIASELGIGPRQFPTLEGYITEEYIQGTAFSRLKGESIAPPQMHNLGRHIGELLTALHSQEIYYNDTTLSDDMGRSHVIVDASGKPRLIDYGVAMRLVNHPQYSDEEVFDFARTLPEVNMMLQLYGESPEQKQHLILNYKRIMTSLTRDQILHRDLTLLEEGISLASMRLNVDMKPFVEGFKETYVR